MTTIETADLFSPAAATGARGGLAGAGTGGEGRRGMSGLEAMCAIRDGILPPPPMARLIGFRYARCRARADRDGTRAA